MRPFRRLHLHSADSQVKGLHFVSLDVPVMFVS